MGGIIMASTVEATIERVYDELVANDRVVPEMQRAVAAGLSKRTAVVVVLSGDPNAQLILNRCPNCGDIHRPNPYNI
jgi:hypothetical protein